MLRVADHFHATDTGRMRQGNEDNFFVRSPLFAVCDGMGGAQAGEVASEIAARAFEDGLPDGDAPELGLAEVIRTANARIHASSRADAARAGMGCTCTSAYVDDDGVAIAHVGDSRGYRLRDGELTQLTRDHTLIWDLMELGKITAEEAERHPQRSVITRALGPEPDVEVDTATFGARAGDLYLLCSDGLTSMVGEDQIEALLERDGDLAGKGRALIGAANQAGGRDNITVILFRLEDTASGGAADEHGQTAEMDAAGGGGRAGDSYLEFDEADLADPEPRQGVTRAEADDATLIGDGAPRVEDVQRALDEQPQTVALRAVRSEEREAAPIRRTAPLPDQPRRKRRRVPVFALAALVALVLLLGGGWIASRAVYFVGTDGDNADAVAVFRGLPYELPGGIKLYERTAVSGVTLFSLPPQQRKTFTDHKLRSQDDAEDLVRQLELGRLSQ